MARFKRRALTTALTLRLLSGEIPLTHVLLGTIVPSEILKVPV